MILDSEGFNGGNNEPRLLHLSLPRHAQWSDGTEVTPSDVADIREYFEHLTRTTGAIHHLVVAE